MEKVENMIEELHRGICTVTFKKVNGETRTMKCTLHPDYLPEQQTLNERTQTKDPNVIPVWDIDQNGWRSFRVDHVNDFNTTTLLKG